MKKLTQRIDVPRIIIGVCLISWGIVIFYPFYNAILNSFMTEAEYMRRPFALYVNNPTLSAYRKLIENANIFKSYKTTLYIVLLNVPIGLLLISSMAYALSRKPFFGSSLINNAIIFTMYFGGGIVPYYILIKSYGLIGSPLSVVVGGLVDGFNYILIKNYFYSLPTELEESAKLDGANDLVVFGKIFFPLAKPVIATVVLFTAVGKWNEWFQPMIFISDPQKWPLQLILREIISDASANIQKGETIVEGMRGGQENVFAVNVQMAALVATMLPIMLVYPFLQKFFMKGIMVGAVKG